MTIDEIKDYLKNNVQIKLDHNYNGDYYGGGTNYITVKILVDGEEIDVDEISFDAPDRCRCAD